MLRSFSKLYGSKADTTYGYSGFAIVSFTILQDSSSPKITIQVEVELFFMKVLKGKFLYCAEGESIEEAMDIWIDNFNSIEIDGQHEIIMAAKFLFSQYQNTREYQMTNA